MGTRIRLWPWLLRLWRIRGRIRIWWIRPLLRLDSTESELVIDKTPLQLNTTAPPPNRNIHPVSKKKKIYLDQETFFSIFCLKGVVQKSILVCNRSVMISNNLFVILFELLKDK